MFDRIPAGWDVQEVNRDGKRVGFFCVQENEIHCWRDESAAGRWITRQDLERLTKPLFLKYGVIKTKVRIQNLQGHRFVSRLGFHATSQDDHFIYYECKRLRHARY